MVSGARFADARVIEWGAAFATHAIATVSLRVDIYEIPSHYELLAPGTQAVRTVFSTVDLFVTTRIEGVVAIITHAVGTKLPIRSYNEIFQRSRVVARSAQAIIAIVDAIHFLEFSWA
jgi:hypothetical protein